MLRFVVNLFLGLILMVVVGGGMLVPAVFQIWWALQLRDWYAVVGVLLFCVCISVAWWPVRKGSRLFWVLAVLAWGGLAVTSFLQTPEINLRYHAMMDPYLVWLLVLGVLGVVLVVIRARLRRKQEALPT